MYRLVQAAHMEKFRVKDRIEFILLRPSKVAGLKMQQCVASRTKMLIASGCFRHYIWMFNLTLALDCCHSAPHRVVRPKGSTECDANLSFGGTHCPKTITRMNEQAVDTTYIPLHAIL